MNTRTAGWIILTYEPVWQASLLTPGVPVVLDSVLEVDLLGEDDPAQQATPCSTCPEAFRHHLTSSAP
jgi:hypothetical protein